MTAPVLNFEQVVVSRALSQLGAPYLWAGRGEWYVRETQVRPVHEAGCEGLAFDCAGLVTWCAHLAGAGDLRGWWGADHLWQALPPAEPGALALAFYGPKLHATHVAIDLGHGIVLEAAGGDSTTTTYALALERRARVRIGLDARGDRLGTRSLAALRTLPVRPPHIGGPL